MDETYGTITTKKHKSSGSVVNEYASGFNTSMKNYVPYVCYCEFDQFDINKPPICREMGWKFEQRWGDSGEVM